LITLLDGNEVVACETCAEMAARIGINVHRFRHYLRRHCGWHSHYDRWSWPPGTDEHRQMEQVARYVQAIDWVNTCKMLGDEAVHELLVMRSGQL
jgi:hypothetical protein